MATRIPAAACTVSTVMLYVFATSVSRIELIVARNAGSTNAQMPTPTQANPNAYTQLHKAENSLSVSELLIFGEQMRFSEVELPK